MSLDSSWMESQKRAVLKHFKSQSLSFPWNFEDPDISNDNVSVTVLDLKAKRLNREEHLLSFKVRLVCTTPRTGLYDLEAISGEASSLLLEPVIMDDVCALPLSEEIEVTLFDFKHSHKQSLMIQLYSSRLRG